MVVVTEPLSVSLKVIVWVPFSLSSLTSTSMVLPRAPTGPASPVSPFTPSLIMVVVVVPSLLRTVRVWVPLLLLVTVTVGLLPSLGVATLGTSIWTVPFALYLTTVLLPFTIFAWYLTTVFAGVPELWLASVYSIVALVPLPFWNSTMSLFLTSNSSLTVGAAVFLAVVLPPTTQWWLLTASATAYNCEPLIASVEDLEIRPAATLVIWRSLPGAPTLTTPTTSPRLAPAKL